MAYHGSCMASGRVWVQHQDFRGKPQPITILVLTNWVFFLCLCMQMSGRKKGTANHHSGGGCHCQSPFRRWPWTQAQVVNSNSTLAGKETWHNYIVKFWTPFKILFNFMQFLGKFGKIICWHPPPKFGTSTSEKFWIRPCYGKLVCCTGNTEWHFEKLESYSDFLIF